jgi:predicted DCC family thiol-disulfide oxidoreductase YuxK
MQRMLTVWFDGGCPLCRREIALMRRLDRRGRIDFVDVADDAAPRTARQTEPRCLPASTPARVTGC